ncbi:Hypothetical protein DEACI_2095 [Acididesulfobacillus acetoxydans]|uniref:Uncharacterized protein n=1 Tax=Acididesulfobacillus acetoxydans TaxID=1561005 RepID=A0A8S0W391_9FIRM|nr:hypothetical protein [Acididesulfobacillus acetoxydans]CAA7601428.1 Hypothetical protein DEACI_2095 [Acididesulfobacillus acetoxydans]CEJ08859.1 Hypothetical protein DEACI_3340 [Acididesulfobacillus acetoxydans]
MAGDDIGQENISNSAWRHENIPGIGEKFPVAKTSTADSPDYGEIFLKAVLIAMRDTKTWRIP